MEPKIPTKAAQKNQKQQKKKIKNKECEKPESERE